MPTNPLSTALDQNPQALLNAWINEQKAALGRKLLQDTELQAQCTDFLRALSAAARSGEMRSLDGPEWTPVKELLSSVSRQRGLAGYTPSETATFIFSLKRPLFEQMRATASGDALAATLWSATEVLDGLGLYTTEVYQRSREEVIARQQQEMLELSTPVVKLWEGVLALPMIGTLDSARTQVVMETLLQKIVETGSQVAILDITGVPTVDTLVAQHLLKTVAAARLMGADCIISGIRPQIAQTIVHLGVDLGTVITKATLADAFALALTRSGMAVMRKDKAAAQDKRKNGEDTQRKADR
jgi:rsbT co-antagonist protein RsbR